MNNKDSFDVVMTLPPAQILPTNLLASVFNKTTATYKFYWFLVDYLAIEKSTRK